MLNNLKYREEYDLEVIIKLIFKLFLVRLSKCRY